MPTPRSKWWTAHSTIDLVADAATKGRFKNLCDLLCERYWRDGCDADELATQMLDINAIRRVVQSQDRPTRCTQMFQEMTKAVRESRGIGSLGVSPILHGKTHIGCTLEWPNAAEYLGLKYRQPGKDSAQHLAQHPAPQNQTRPDRTFSDSERVNRSGFSGDPVT